MSEFKKGWNKVLDEKTTPEMRERAVRGALVQWETPSLAERLRAWLLPAAGLALAAGLAIALLPRTPPAPAGAELAVIRHDPAMLREADMFAELKLLRAWDGEKAQETKKWPKKKS